MFGFAAMINWAKHWATCRCVLTLLIVFCLCGIATEKTFAQPGVTYDIYTFGGLEFRVYREGVVYPNASQARALDGDENWNIVRGTLEGVALRDTLFAAQYASQFIQSHTVHFGLLQTNVNGYAGGGTLVMDIDIIGDRLRHPVVSSGVAFAKTNVHEWGHILGITGLGDGPTYDGIWATLINHGQPIPLAGETADTYDSGHLDVGNTLLTYASWTGDKTFFTEIELAIFKDRNLSYTNGSQINLADHFGYSEYRDGQTITINQGFAGSDNSYRFAGGTWSSNQIHAIGVHLAGGYSSTTPGGDYVPTVPTNVIGNTLILDANIHIRDDNPNSLNSDPNSMDILNSGYGGVGIYIENNNNTVTITGNSTIRVEGAYGVGVITTLLRNNPDVTNRGTILTNFGTIEATGHEGRGVWFDALTERFDNFGTIYAARLNANGNAVLDNNGRHILNDALVVSSGVQVGTINLLSGSTIVGNIDIGSLTAHFQQGATLSPYAGFSNENIFATLTVNGDLQMDDGSILRVGLGNGVIGGSLFSDSDLVIVTGAATIGSIIIEMMNLHTGMNTYTLLTADTLNYDSSGGGILFSFMGEMITPGGAIAAFGGRTIANVLNPTITSTDLQLAVEVIAGDATRNTRLTWSGDESNVWLAWNPGDTQVNNWSSTYFVDGDGVTFRNDRINPSENDSIGYIDIVGNVIVADMRVEGNLNWTFGGGSIRADSQFVNPAFNNPPPYGDPADDPRLADATGMLVMAGTGVLTFQTFADFSDGGILVQSGVLHIDEGGNIRGEIANNALVVFNTSGNVDTGGGMSGTGNLWQLGAGTTTLGGNNTYTGVTFVENGMLRVGSLTGTSRLEVHAGATFAGLSRNTSEVIVDGDLLNDGTISTINYLRADRIENAGRIENIGTLDVFALVATGGYWDAHWLSNDVLQLVYNPGNGSILGLYIDYFASPGSNLYGNWHEIVAYNFSGSVYDYNVFIYRDPANPFDFLDGYDYMYSLGQGSLVLIYGDANEVYGDFENSGVVFNVGTLTARNVINDGIMSDIGVMTTVRNDSADSNDSVGGNLRNNGWVTGGNDRVNVIDVASNLINNGWIGINSDLDSQTGIQGGRIDRIDVATNFINGWGWITVTDDDDNEQLQLFTGGVRGVGTINIGSNLTNNVDSYLGDVGSLNVGNNLTNDGWMEDVGEINIANRFNNNAGAVLRNVGTLSVARVDNSGIIDNVVNGMTVSGNLTNTGGQMNNIAGLTVGGNVINRNGGGIANVTNFRIDGTLNNSVNIAFNNTTGDFSGIFGIANMRVSDLNNSGQMSDIGTLTITNSLTNSGDLWTIGTFSANNVSNTGYIVDVGNMMVGNRLTNSGGVAQLSTLIANSIINTGYLLNFDRIESNEFVNQGGTIAGIGTIDMRGGTFVNQSGTIAAGNFDLETYAISGVGTLKIDGDFYSTMGTFVVGISGANNSLIEVSGSASVYGGTVEVVLEPLNYIVDHRYRFLTADGGLSVDVELISGNINDPLFKTVVRYDDESYWLSVVRAFSYTGEGRTMNQRKMGRYLDRVGIYPGGDFRNVLKALDSARWGGIALMRTIDAETIPDPLDKALDQMGGSIYGTMTTSSFQNTVMFHASLANVLRRDYNTINSVNAHFGKGTPPSGNLWGMVYGHAGSSKHDGNVNGYRHGFSGIMAGFDRINDRQIRLGLFLSMGQSSLSSELEDRMTSQEFMLGHYLRRDTDRSYLLVHAGVGTHRYDTRRKITFGYSDIDDLFLDRTARNQHSAYLATAHAEAGLRYRNTVLNLSPFVGLQYTGLYREGFTERGAESLNLTSKAEDYHSLRTMFGMRFDSAPFRVRSGLASFYGNVAWMYELEADKRHTEFTARFSDSGVLSGPSFTVHGNDPGRDWVQAGFGLNYDVNANFRGFTGYDAYANQRQVMHSANLGFIYQR